MNTGSMQKIGSAVTQDSISVLDCVQGNKLVSEFHMS
jgi:hypothetical protein